MRRRFYDETISFQQLKSTSNEYEPDPETFGLRSLGVSVVAGTPTFSYETQHLVQKLGYHGSVR